MRRALVVLALIAAPLYGGETCTTDVRTCGSSGTAGVTSPVTTDPLSFTGVVTFDNAANTPVTFSDGSTGTTVVGTTSACGGGASGAANSVCLSANTITGEGATADAFETMFAFGDATADQTITWTGAASSLGAVVASPAVAASTTAGNSLAFTASPAIAGSTNAGAAAGGGITLTGGAAAQLTSGNANGGGVTLAGGAGIGTGITGIVTVNTATAFRAVPPQDGSVGIINSVATLTPNATGNPTGLRLVWTGSGSSTGSPQGLVNFMGAGYTGASSTILNYFENDSAGTNATFLAGNSAIQGSVVGATTGINNGMVMTVNSSTVSNVAVTGLANGNSAGVNAALVGLTTNGGAGTKTAVYGGLKATVPTYISAAAQFDNAAIAAPILVAQDSGAALPTTAATATFQILDGALPQLGNGVLTSATMTAETQANERTSTHSYTWSNAQVVALGAALTGDITVATLPAKTQVVDALVVITGAASGPTTLTVSCGDAIGGTPFINYVQPSDAKAAANTVYGDASGERGTAIDTEWYYIPSYAATTLVTCHFIATIANLNTTTGSTGRVILTTRLLP